MIPKKLLILVDVDDVVAPMLGEGWLPMYNRDYDDNLTPDDIVDWDLAQFVKPEARDIIYDYLSDPMLYDNVKPVIGSQYYVGLFRELGHRVVFVTTGVFPAKINWLYKYKFLNTKTDPLNGEKNLVITGDKSLIYGDVIIDDKPSTIENHPAELSLLFDRPHNRKSDYPIRVYDWKDVYEDIATYFGFYDVPIV